MKTMDKSITIDMERFGMKGEVVMSAPTFRRQRMLRNFIGRNAKMTVDEEGKPILESLDLGDAEVWGVLVYVESAPFRTDLDSFMDYCDELDRIRKGYGQDLFDAMTDAVGEIDKGEGSPLESSAASETASSA